MKVATRGAQITRQYLLFLDKHIDDVIQGRTMEFMALNKIAREIAVSPKHLCYTVQKEKENILVISTTSKLSQRQKNS